MNHDGAVFFENNPPKDDKNHVTFISLDGNVYLDQHFPRVTVIISAYKQE